MLEIKNAVTPLFVIPDNWQLASQSVSTMQYLEKNHVLPAYKDHRVDVRYDPVLRRHVFLTWDAGRCVGATGRKQNAKVDGPKWYIYNKSGGQPLVVPQYGVTGFPDYSKSYRTGVVVEDGASASAVSCVADGVALLGTYLQPNYMSILSQYNTLIMALDPDAIVKSLAMQKELEFYVDKVRVVMISDDLKYMTPDQVQWEIM
jgi:high-affinity Fe2+/Pb2+ permease